MADHWAAATRDASACRLWRRFRRRMRSGRLIAFFGPIKTEPLDCVFIASTGPTQDASRSQAVFCRSVHWHFLEAGLSRRDGHVCLGREHARQYLSILVVQHYLFMQDPISAVRAALPRRPVLKMHRAESPKQGISGPFSPYFLIL